MVMTRGVGTGGISVYIPPPPTPKSVYLNFFMWLFCLLDPRTNSFIPTQIKLLATPLVMTANTNWRNRRAASCNVVGTRYISSLKYYIHTVPMKDRLPLPARLLMAHLANSHALRPTQKTTLGDHSALETAY